jgi:hypothetical protein
MENIPKANMDIRADIVEDFYGIVQRSLASAAIFEDILQDIAHSNKESEGENEV